MSESTPPEEGTKAPQVGDNIPPHPSTSTLPPTIAALEAQIQAKEDAARKPPRRIVNYVTEQGEDTGKAVPCVITDSKLLHDEQTEPHVMLAKVDSPDVHFQSWVRFSRKKEPGTWHDA